MPSRRASAADHQAIASAASVGLEITPRQLERWRGEALIPTPTRTSLGRGRGTTSHYDDETIAYIVDFASHTVPRGTLWKIPAEMFALGQSVPETCLRVSYQRIIDVLDAFTKMSESGDPLDHAEQVARELQRRPGPSTRARRNHLRQTFDQLVDQSFFEQHDGDRTSFAGFEQSMLINVVLGAIAPDQMDFGGLRELAAATMPFVQPGADQWGADVPDVDDAGFLDDLHATMTSMTLEQVRDAALTAPYSFLCVGRDAVRNLFGWMSDTQRASFDQESSLIMPLIVSLFVRQVLRVKFGNFALSWKELELLSISETES